MHRSRRQLPSPHRIHVPNMQFADEGVVVKAACISFKVQK